MQGLIKIIVADDHHLFREGVISQLDNDVYKIIGEASDGQEVLSLIELQTPDLVILDINMPHLNGIEVAQKIKTIHPRVKVLFLSMFSDYKFIARAIREGAADGYILKDSGKKELLNAIDTIVKGESYFSEKVSNVFIKGNQSTNELVEGKVVLTKREKEVLKLIAEEYTTKEIAQELFISTHTVETHRKNLIIKLGVKGLAGLVRYAVNEGI